MLVSDTVDPKTIAVIKTYAHFHGVCIETVRQDDGATDMAELKRRLGEGGVAGVVVQQPNRYGVIEDYGGLADVCHENKALLIMNCVAADLALLKTPGEWGLTSPWATASRWASRCRSAVLRSATCAARRKPDAQDAWAYCRPDG